MTALTTARAVIDALGSAATMAPTILGFIQNTVVAVENTSKSGTDKMTAVLNSAEAFLGNAVPNALGAVEALMKAIEAFVNEIVAIYNAAGVFVHGAEVALGIAKA